MIRLVICVMAGLAWGLISAALPYRIAVTVRNSDETPIESCPVRVEIDGYWRCLLRTNGQGIAADELLGVPVGAKVIRVWISPLGRPLAPGTADAMASADADILTLALRQTPQDVRIPIVAGQFDYSTTIRLPLARRVSGKMKQGGAIVKPLAVYGPGGCFQMTRFAADSTFTVGGFGFEESLLGIFMPSGLVIVRDVPAGNTDVDLGDIDVPSMQLDATASLELRRAGTDSTDGPLSGVTLVSTSGSVVFSRMATELTPVVDGEGVELRGAQVKCNVPAGEYIVVPGVFDGSKVQMRVIGAARRGELAAIIARANIPRVEFSGTTTTTTVIDTFIAQAALLGQ